MTERVPGQNLLLGRSEGRLLHWVALALVLFTLMFGLHTPATTEVIAPMGIPTGFVVNMGVFAPLVLMFAALPAYFNKGILMSLLIAAGPSFGAYLPAAIFDTPDFPVPLFPVLRSGVVVAIAVGSVGFILGTGLRQLTARETST